MKTLVLDSESAHFSTLVYYAPLRTHTLLSNTLYVLWTSLSSRPSPYELRARFNCAGWENRSSGKAWDDSSRESRTVVGQYLARAPWCRRGTLFS